MLLSACKPINDQAFTPTAVILDQSALIQTSVARVTEEAAKTQIVASVPIKPDQTHRSASVSNQHSLLLIPSETPVPSHNPFAARQLGAGRRSY